MTLTYGSAFAGIEGFGLGFQRVGMKCLWQVEIDDKCRMVLARHWPNIDRSVIDVTKAGKHNLRAVELICGGFPCQDLSVAGKREGLSGERSGLWFQFYRILEELRPRWVVIENVPGLLSSYSGPEPPSDLEEGQEWEATEESDFGIVLRGLAELRYGIAWRVLDAQYYGVAQRRRRVFIVGSLGNGRAAEVLFESESSAWDSPPSRETGQGIADNAISRALTSSQQRIDAETETFCITPWDHESKRIHNSEGVAPTIAGSDGGGGQRMPYVTTVWDNGQGDPNAEESDVAYCVNPQMNQGVATVGALQARDYKGVGSQYVNEDKCVVAFDWQSGGDVRLNVSDEHTSAIQASQTPAVLCPTIGADIARQAGGHPGIEEYTNAVMESGFGVRRLTPTECERLQGFPDDWTRFGASLQDDELAVTELADSPRYRMLGNAVAVPVAEWLGRRIMEVEEGERR